MIRSLFDYTRFFAHTLLNAESRALLRSHRERPAIVPGADRNEAMCAAVNWLMRAQDQNADGGFASYHLVQGWSTSYPETTGYIIPTLINAGEHLKWREPIDRAIRAAEWLLTIQRADGGWQGGRIGEDRPSIVFNTAQVIRGMLAAHAITKRDDFLRAAVRAADRIVSVQEDDGTWRKHNFLGVARAYDAYVDAPLLKLAATTGDDRYRISAQRNLDWIGTQATIGGWFYNCDNTIEHNDRPITHTLAYATDGLLESGGHEGFEGARAFGQLGASGSLLPFLTSNWMHGRYDKHWHGTEDLITTGGAQFAISWARVFEQTGIKDCRDGLTRMCDLLIAIQRKSFVGPADAHGALPGSYPLWGRYEKFAFPNWATKYFVDALLCAEGKLPTF